MNKKIFLLLILSLCIIAPVKAEEQKNLNDLPLTITGIVNKTYTGSEIKQTVTVSNGGMNLKENEDYTVSYSNNINAGTAKIYINGEGTYTGQKTLSFKILRRSVSSFSISSIKSQVYSGKYKKPLPVVYYNDKKLVRNTDYTVSYKNNKKIGTATMYISGKGNYTGKRKVSFKIIPKTPTLKSLKMSKGKITIKWSKITNATGYKIYKSSNGGSYKLYKTITSNKKTSYTTKKVAYGTYRFKVRAYKKVGKKYYYGNYSNIKKITRKNPNMTFSISYIDGFGEVVGGCRLDALWYDFTVYKYFSSDIDVQMNYTYTLTNVNKSSNHCFIYANIFNSNNILIDEMIFSIDNIKPGQSITTTDYTCIDGPYTSNLWLQLYY